ncbi:MAG: sulfatase-like hydrolase/transferase, partial [Verrucomicrobiae bacterium]|nr:sulfatase-like hydrolase/transferase [Verrucomicrobiae bacterium]
MRRTFDLAEIPDALSLKLHAASAAKIYLNGRDIHENPRQLQHHYQNLTIHDAAGALRKGRNVLAIEVTAEGDRNGIDAGLFGYPHLPTPAASAPPKAEQPNILFIFIDDMGYGDLSITGNQDVPTPNIDRLAKEGMMLTQFHVASPICSPSRVACT